MLRAFFVSLGSAVLMGQAAIALAAEQPKLDNYGDPLPTGAVVRLGTERLRTQSGFCWMPDGSLATAADGQVRIWDIQDGRLLKSLSIGSSDYRHKLAASADGTKLACASQSGGLTFFDLKAGTQVYRPTPRRSDENYIDVLAIAPDGSNVVTGSYRAPLKLWDFTEGNVRRILEVENKAANYPSFAFSTDSRLVAVGAGRRIVIFDLSDPDHPSVIDRAHGSEVLSLAFTRDGKRLVSSGGGKYVRTTTPKGRRFARSPPELRVWDVAERKPIQDLRFPETVEQPGTMGLGPDDNTVVTTHRKVSLVWKLAEAKVVRTFDGQSNRFGPILLGTAIDPTGQYVAADVHETHIRVWNLATGQPLLATEKRHSGAVTAAAWSPDSQTIATGAWDRSVKLWNAKTGALLRTMERGEGVVKDIDFSSDGKLIAVAAEDYDPGEFKFIGALRMFRISDGGLAWEQLLPSRAHCVAVSSDSTKVAVGMGGLEEEMESPPLVWLHEAAMGQKLAEFKTFAGSVVAVDWSMDDRTLSVAARDNTLRQINVGAGAEFSLINAPHDAEFRGEVHDRSLGKAMFGPRSVDAFTSSDYPAHVHRWNLDTGKKVWTIKVSESATGPIVISPDSRILACGWGHSGGSEPNTSGISLWNVATQQELMQIDLAGASPYSLAFAPDGRRVVTGFDNGTALVWDVSSAWEKLGK